MKRTVKNRGKSVKARLLNLMNSSGYRYMYLLGRYFNERLLYRVSVSDYCKNFLLKGDSLLYAINGLETRPTIDIDFMAQNISRDSAYLENVFREILSIQCEEDGVTFDVEGIKSEPITINETILYEAIQATFDNRGLENNSNLKLFTEAFYTDEMRLNRWRAFLKKIQWKEDIRFADVMKKITFQLQPIYQKYWDSKQL